MGLLIALGLIGMKLVVVTSVYTNNTEVLPPPQLSLMTSGTIYMGQNVEMQCTAPADLPEGRFFLIAYSSGQNLQTVQAPETRNSVSFTIESSYTLKSIEYVCQYQCYVGTEIQTSELSNILSMTLSVPVWVFVLVGLVGLLILVALVLVTLCLVRRNKRKKQEQRESSVWIDQNMTTDWSDGNHNVVFSLNSTSKTDISHTHLNNMDSQTESGSATPFSTFRI
ncbi:uncharacterized protein LOC122927199 isoform X2 [Bufo gargarizans]|uniref:uncharacterized protein LOC122927199 isoform X2 n=1 Tax=Bufo gargarizans TaxID=30331 RepID=UPI001CF153E4|nr:uncharacterized protein LOC122927199 isoform X2 [Bufo gargarizans]